MIVSSEAAAPRRRGHQTLDSQAELTRQLQAAQVLERRSLWVDSDAIQFTPQVLPQVFGDGRALFAFTTINTRPAYWIVRGDSAWCTGYDLAVPDDIVANDIGEHSEAIIDAIEEAFGKAELGVEYLYNRRGRAYDPETARFLRRAELAYPVVDYGGGCSWGRRSWPKLPGLRLRPHPYSRFHLILDPTEH